VPATEGVKVPLGAGQADTANTPHVTSKAFDFPGPVPLRKSYIVASTPRSGSTFLCSLLWQTGVLGAPSEYWNCRKRASPKTIGTRMMERLEASSGVDYLTKLLACRTSKNGIFGLKVHFAHFEEVFNGFPQVLELLAPIKFIYIERQDKLAQAVSMARSLQTGIWAFGRNRERPTISYDRDLISRCLRSLEVQRRGWLQWFATNRVEPHVVSYENLVADTAGVVSSIIDLLDVRGDEPHEVQQRKLARQGDGTNKEWAARYQHELAAERERGAADTAMTAGTASANVVSAMDRPAVASFVERYERIRNSGPDANPGRLGVFATKRRRDRYEAIIARNRELLRGANVLDIQCGNGYFSLAALDAGARRVVGLESRKKPIESAQENFEKFEIDPDSYRLEWGKIHAKLPDFYPGEFDVVMCQESLSDPHFFFQQLHRLKPKHVIIDIAISARKRPVIMFKTTTFKIRGNATSSTDLKRKRSAFIAAVPNHALIKMLCDHFGFRCRFINWRTLNLANWLGIGDYEHDRRRTYVLDRI
jgi:trehalose 2-sulfotransferase